MRVAFSCDLRRRQSRTYEPAASSHARPTPAFFLVTTDMEVEMDGYMPGPPFWFAAAVCAATVVAAAHAALRPSEQRQKMLRPLCAATAFAATTSFLFGLLNGIVWLRYGLRSASVTTDEILETVGHALMPLAMGSAALTLVWLLAAAGRRRLA